MSVNVDEAGRRDASGRVYHLSRTCVRPQRSNGCDLAVSHADIRAEPSIACAVQHARVADQEIVVAGCRGQLGRQHENQQLHESLPEKKSKACARYARISLRFTTAS